MSIRSRIFKNRKGEDDDSKLFSYIVAILLAVVSGIALYYMIWWVSHAFLPK